MDVHKIETAIDGRLVGTKILHYDTLSSTMDEAARLAEEGSPEGVVVIADEQTVGRGRFARKWVAPAGSGILLSVILRPTSDQLRYINMAATIAVCDVVAEFGGVCPAVKWPNDVMVRGRKISGILVESAIEAGQVHYAIVGIGVNVNLDPSEHPEVADSATSLYREADTEVDGTMVAISLLKRLDEFYRRVMQGEALTREWAGRLETLGRTVSLRWKDRINEGYARDVDEQGNLLLDQPDGSTITVVAGEVTFQL